MRAKDFALEAKPLAPLEVPTPAQSTVEKSVKMANHIDKVLDQYEIKKSIIQQEIDRLKDQIESLKYGPPEGSTVIQKGRGWVGRDREGHPIGGGPVDEAFDRPYKLKWEKGEAGEDYDALVRLPDGSNLSIMFNEEGPGQYMVEFWRGAEQSVTGEGDAQRIFATVLAAIAKFIRQHQPQSIVFSAHKEDDPEQKSDSRSKLYNRLVQRYAGTMGYSYRSWDTGDSVQYELTRLKPGVAESSPNFNREWDEATRYPEFVNLGKKKWIELVSKGKPVTVTRKNVNKINNTDAADPNSFKLLDPEKQKRALAQLANGDVEMPIVARYSDGYLELIGGNTRLTAQMAKDGQAKVWLFNVPEELTQGVAEGLTEIENMPARNFDGERMLRLRIPAKRNLQPLLGGTDLLYAVDQAPGGDPRVVIVEPGVRAITKPQIVAVLQLEPVNYLPNTVQVGFITVDKDYRGRGLAKALYGIVFTKMRKNLLSGDTQTPGGKRNWMSLASIPGVEVKGMVRISNDIFDLNKNRVSSNYQKYIDQTMDQIMELGGQFFHKNKDFSFWLFDVVPGKGQLQPYVQNSLSKLYGYDARNLLLATWNRGTNESQQGVAEGLNFDEIYGKHLKVTDNNGDPRKPGFSLVTPLNGDSWNWRERPEFKDLVKQKLNDPGFLGDHKYQQIIASMSGKQFDPTKHIAKENFAERQGVAEGNRFDEPLTGYHIVYKNSGNPVLNTPSFETKDQAQKYLMTKMFANHQDFKVVHTANVGVAEGAVEDLAKDLKNPHSYNAIDHMMQTIANKSNVTPKELHDQFVEKYGMTPDEWIKNEQGVEETYGAKLHTEYKRNRFKQLDKIKQQQEKALGLGEAGCNMTNEGRYCSEHGMMECPGYSMTETSVQDKLHQQHQELRKKRGLPDPSYYKKLAAQKQAEIDALRAEIAADQAKSMKESLRPGERHHYEDDPKTGKRVYKGIRGDQYDAPKKKTTGHEPDADRDRAAHRAHDRSMTESIESYMEELERAGYGLQEEKVRLDPKCWKGKKIGSPKTKVKGGVRVNNCVPK